MAHEEKIAQDPLKPESLFGKVGEKVKVFYSYFRSEFEDDDERCVYFNVNIL